MNSEEKNKNWMEPLHRWLTGDARREDEHELDAMAKEDPFFADALEGFRSVPEGNHAASITKLKVNLRRQTRRKRSAGFYLLRIAAVGAVLVVAWFVFRQFDTQEKSQAGISETSLPPKGQQPTLLLSNESATSSTAEMSETGAGIKSGESSLSKENTAFKGSGRNARTLATIEPTSDDSNAAIAPFQIAEQPENAVFDSVVNSDDVATIVAKEEQESPGRQAQKPEVQEETISPSQPQEALKRAEALPKANAKADSGRSTMPRKIAGTVTDENGESLIGANVLIKGTNRGVITDIHGWYSIELPDEGAALVFTYTGFSSLEVNVGKEETLDVQLSGSAALSEVVVTGMGKDKKRKVETPGPEGGFKKFEKYVKENLRYPASAAQAGVKGMVIVRFWIQMDGRPAGFEIIQSLGYGCDEEAIRLLSEGPKWKGSPGLRTDYSFQF